MSEDADDLPRTFRREKEAREREARERAARERAAAPTLSAAPDPYGIHAAHAAPKIYADPAAPAGAVKAAALDVTVPAVVRAIDVPFGQLVTFFLKAVIAAIPALILLMAVLWGLGQALEMFFPDLLKMKILIGVG
jgi:hypothetical protein